MSQNFAFASGERFLFVDGLVCMGMNTQQQRRLVQGCLVSINGVIGEPAAWAGPYFGPGSAEDSLAALRESAAMLMGRRTYEIFSRQWPAASGEYADYLNAMPKYVFSTTLREAEWANTTVISGDVVAEVRRLKAMPGQDLIMYGHGQLGQTLCDAGLVDELNLIVVPTFVREVSLLFQSGGSPHAWELVDAGPGMDPGLAKLSYRLAAR